jgi:hypothetical protein
MKTTAVIFTTKDLKIGIAIDDYFTLVHQELDLIMKKKLERLRSGATSSAAEEHLNAR